MLAQIRDLRPGPLVQKPVVVPLERRATRSFYSKPGLAAGTPLWRGWHYQLPEWNKPDGLFQPCWLAHPGSGRPWNESVSGCFGVSDFCVAWFKSTVRLIKYQVKFTIARFQVMPIPNMPTLSVLPLKQTKVFFLPLLVLIVSCGGGGESLRVFAASSLMGAFTEVANAFEAENPGVAVKLDFGGSQRMRSQIELGARGDIFASADSVHMDALVAADLVSGTPVDFASNSLVVLAMSQGPVDTIADLAKPGVKVVLANSNVPVGAYTREVLENLSQDPAYGLGSSFKDNVLANLASGEPNVNSAFQKVVLGVVDAGIVYETETLLALEAETRNIHFIPIPTAANVKVDYPIAVLAEAAKPELADSFVKFVLSDRGRTLLRRHGFKSP